MFASLPRCMRAFAVSASLASAFASQVAADSAHLCIPNTHYTGAGGAVAHPNLNGGHEVWAGTILAYAGGHGPAIELYCIDLHHTLCHPACYEPAAEGAPSEIAWILANHYPAVPGEPASLDTEARRARAVQLAIWHFSDGLDISTGGTPAAVFDAARAIVAAAQTAAVARVPASLELSPGASAGLPPATHTVTATLRDQNGDPMPGVSLHFAVTGAHTASGDATTDAAGQAAFSYAGTHTGEDDIRATVEYTLPIGLRWKHGSCQTLVQAESTPGSLRAEAKRNWDGHVAAQQRSWGFVKTLYRD